jgi:WD40 repeat protein
MVQAYFRRCCSLLEADFYFFLVDKLLWSGSADQTIRVWDLGTNKCVGILSRSTKGHNGPITCLCHLYGAATVNENYIVSGGADCEVKLWKPTGEFVFSCNHSTCVTALSPFQDEMGG